MKKRLFFVFLLLILYLLACLSFYANAVSSDIADNVLRLHVIANSNEKEDQALKLKVRDGIITYLNTSSCSFSSKEDVLQYIRENEEQIQSIAKSIIEKNGYSYDVTVQLGNFSFPTKNYGDITLPAGFYDALRVNIGNASGQNWWCVLFPSLCFVDVSNGVIPEESKETLQKNLGEEDYKVISSDETSFQIKFKLIELFENARMVMAKK